MENRKRQARGLEQVSHLFLSGQGYSDQAIELTEKPGKADAAVIPHLLNDTACKVEVEETASAVSVKRGFPLVFCSSNCLDWETSFLAYNVALEFARRNFSVGLIETTTRLSDMFLLFGGFENIDAIFWEKDFDSGDFLTIFNRLDGKSDVMVMNVPPRMFGVGNVLSSKNAFFIIPTTVCSEGLLNTYLLIKRISRSVACEGVGVLMIDEHFSRKAEEAFSVVAEMARKFLSCQICFMGTIHRGDDLSDSKLARTPLLSEGVSSFIFESIKKLTDNLIQQSK